MPVGELPVDVCVLLPGSNSSSDFYDFGGLFADLTFASVISLSFSLITDESSCRSNMARVI